MIFGKNGGPPSLCALLGIALVVVAATRFVRTGQLLDDQETHSVGGVRAELLLSVALALTATVPLSVDPLVGAEREIVGAVVSGGGITGPANAAISESESARL